MKRTFALLLVLLCSVSFARAQDDAARRAKVETLMTSMHVDRMMNQMMNAMKAQVAQSMQSSMGGAQMTAEQQKITTDFQNRMLDLVMGSVSWKALEPQFVDLYLKNFTDAEIDAMVAFYSSAAGQSMLEKMPAMMTQSMTIAQSRMVDLQPKIKALTDEYAKQMAQASGKKS